MTTFALTNLAVSDSWNMHDGWGAAWMAPMMLGMALFWGAIIFGIVWLIRSGIEPRQQELGETALTILDRRFAEGALSPDDYHARRNLLTGSTAHPSVTGLDPAAIEGLDDEELRVESPA